VKILKYPHVPDTNTESDLEHHVHQLALLAEALTTEIGSLLAELSGGRSKQIDFDLEGIDFYEEVERYEIELIKTALNRSGGNQTRAAKLLRLKATTLNAKMKHYGLNPVRSIMMERANAQPAR